MPSFNNPKVTNAINSDVAEIQKLLTIVSKQDYTGATNIPTNAKRIATVTGGVQLQKYSGSSWASVGKLMHDVDTVDGHHASTTASAGKIPVYDSKSRLVGSITGNAATATKLASKKTIDIGGIASADAVGFDGSGNITIPINSITVANENDNALVGIVSKAHGGTGRNDGAAADVIVNSLAGQVKASEYGQIGYTKFTKSDLDTLTVPGHYWSNSATIELHYPVKSSEIHTIHVYQQGTMVRQILRADVSEWIRTSTNSGSSWTAWECIASAPSVSLKFYISKSGSDLNTGLSAEYPVASIARAIEIARTSYPVSTTNNGAWIMLCVGEGDWGALYLHSLPFKVYIRPYDGAIANEYVSSMPHFSHIQVTNCYLVLQGVYTDVCAAECNATVLIDGYLRAKTIAALQQGYLSVQPSTLFEVVDSSGSNNSCFRAYYGGMLCVWENVKVNIIENVSYTSGFIRCDSNGYLSIALNVALTLSEGVSVTGRKYYLYSPANLGRMIKSFLDSLPGNQSGFIDKGVILNGIPWGGGDVHTYLAADGSWNKDSTSIYARDVAIGGDASDLASARGFFYDTRIPRATSDSCITDFNDYTTPGRYHIVWREGTPYSKGDVTIPVTLNNPGALNGAAGFCDAIIEVDYIDSASYVSSYARCQQKITLTNSETYHSSVFIRVQSVSSGTPWYDWREIISSSSPALIDKLSLYLPLSGGTLTGPLITSYVALIQTTNWPGITISDTSRTASATKMIAVVLDKDGRRFWGEEVTANADGSRGWQLTTRKRDNSGWGFPFRVAEKVDGSIIAQVNSKNIVRSVNGVNADTDGNVTLDLNTGPYITYSSFNIAGQRTWLREWSNNVRELGGYAAGKNQTVTLPRAFADANYYVFICPEGGASEIGVTNLTTASFTVVFENTSSSGFFWHAIGKYA